jgi:hypothetical protein
LGIGSCIPLFQCDGHGRLEEFGRLGARVADENLEFSKSRSDLAEHVLDLIGPADVIAPGTGQNRAFGPPRVWRSLLIYFDSNGRLPLTPSSASFSVILRPMPREAPVTGACFCLSDISKLLGARFRSLEGTVESPAHDHTSRCMVNATRLFLMLHRSRPEVPFYSFAAWTSCGRIRFPRVRISASEVRDRFRGAEDCF